MKAVGVTRFGGPEVLETLELPTPQVGPGGMRIRVHAATVNPVDSMVRRGMAFVSDAPPPYVLGMEVAGVVDAVGPGTETDLVVGQDVMAIVVVSGTDGGYAELVVVPADSVVRMPDGLPYAEAATLPMNGLTAQIALDLLELTPGDTVAVTGAAGAVGGYAVQLAKAAGLRVLADASPYDIDLVRGLGADVVLRRGDTFVEDVLREAPDGVDGLVDTAGIVTQVAGAVRDGGRIATSVGGTPTTSERGITTRNTFVPNYARERAKLEAIRQLAAERRLTARVAHALNADEAAQAHRPLEQGGLRGRIVLTF